MTSSKHSFVTLFVFYYQPLLSTNPEFVLYPKMFYAKYYRILQNASSCLIKSKTQRIQFTVNFLYHLLCLSHNDHPDRCLEALPLLVYPIFTTVVGMHKYPFVYSVCVRMQNLCVCTFKQTEQSPCSHYCTWTFLTAEKFSICLLSQTHSVFIRAAFLYCTCCSTLGF